MAKLEGAFEGTLTPDQQREILELAERLKESRVNHLSVAELEAAAAETGLEPSYVREAMALLQKPGKSETPRFQDFTKFHWLLIAALIPLHLILYSLSSGPSVDNFGFTILGIAVLFGVTSGRNWTTATRALVITSTITFATFIAVRLWNNIYPSHFDYIGWDSVKSLLVYQAGAVLISLFLSQFFREALVDKQSEKKASLE